MSLVLISVCILAVAATACLIVSMGNIKNRPDKRACNNKRSEKYIDGVRAEVPPPIDDQPSISEGELDFDTAGDQSWPLVSPSFAPVPGLNLAQNKMIHLMAITSKACMHKKIAFWAWGSLLQTYVVHKGPFLSWPVQVTSVEFGAIDPSKLDNIQWPDWIRYTKMQNGDRLVTDINSCYLDQTFENENGILERRGITVTLKRFWEDEADPKKLRLNNGTIVLSDIFELGSTLIMGWTLPLPATPEKCLRLVEKSPNVRWARIDAFHSCE